MGKRPQRAAKERTLKIGFGEAKIVLKVFGTPAICRRFCFAVKCVFAVKCAGKSAVGFSGDGEVAVLRYAGMIRYDCRN